jgi:CRISPR system Cascade subunit CasB
METIAGLYGYHPVEAEGGNLGQTCRRLKQENESFEARFLRLLGCGREEICERVRPVVLAARAKGIAVNYEQLYLDLVYWGGRVRERWAMEYWAAGRVE